MSNSATFAGGGGDDFENVENHLFRGAASVGLPASGSAGAAGAAEDAKNDDMKPFEAAAGGGVASFG